MISSSDVEPKEKTEDFRLLLINEDQPFTETPPLLPILKAFQVDERIVEDLSAMLQAAETDGFPFP